VAKKFVGRVAMVFLCLSRRRLAFVARSHNATKSHVDVTAIAQLLLVMNTCSQSVLVSQ
jgi:hypothetical protein